MIFAKYLKEKGLTPAQFSELSGIPLPTVYRLIKRPWIVPMGDLIIRIGEATGGEVGIHDLVMRSRYGRRPAALLQKNGEQDPSSGDQGGVDPSSGGVAG